MKGEIIDMPAHPSMVKAEPQENFTSGSTELTLQYNKLLFFKSLLMEAKTDSGVASSSECPSTSPSTDRSGSPGENAAIVHPYGSHIPYHHWNRNTFMKFSSEPINVPNTVNYKTLLSPKIETRNNAVAAINPPKARSHGRRKVLKCKQCNFVADTKQDLWDHSKVHIKDDKILTCPTCPFVTEYKHHLEYHIRKHTGTKPFKCGTCDYSCINKSMLNSHLKSHSNIYQYRCSDCPYETKYCHSLKLHLRKRNHRPAMVLNTDGSPNPFPIVDVYGTKRGPKVKKVSGPSGTFSQERNQQLQMPYNPVFNQSSSTPLPLPLIPSFMPEMILNLQNVLRQRLEDIAKQNEGTLKKEEVLDLSCKSKSTRDSSEESESECDEEMTTMFFNVEVVRNKDAKDEEKAKREKKEITQAISDDANNNQYCFTCHYCDIRFKEEVMFRFHMGYHSISNPFTCNTCGKECENKVNLFLHIATAAH